MYLRRATSLLLPFESNGQGLRLSPSRCPSVITRPKLIHRLPRGIKERPDQAYMNMFWFLRHKIIYFWFTSVFKAAHIYHISIRMNSSQLLEQINLLQATQQWGKKINSRWNCTLSPVREPTVDNQPLHLSSPHPATATLSVHVAAPAAPCHLCPAKVVLWTTTWVGHAAIFSLEGKACKSASWEEREALLNCHLPPECRKHQFHCSSSDLETPATSFLSCN